MELSPQSVSGTTFKIVKKGYDPDEVRAYLTQLASAIEQTQSQAAAMEARARAAVVRLQEIAAQSPPAGAPTDATTGEAETISRTLLLAQRTADTTVAEANSAATAITEAARTEARQTVAGAQEQVTRLIEDAKSEARRAGESQRIQVESEVQALLARREFLLSDVDYLEQYIVSQRDRLREVAVSLTDMVDRVPGGLGDLRRPLVSAVGDSVPDAPSTATGGVATATAGAATIVDQSAQPADVPADEPVLDETMPMEFVDAEGSGDGDDAGDDDVGDDTRGEFVDDLPNDVADDEPTPPSGTARFLFEDITQEVPATRTADDKP